ncbi:hypothetical protein KUL42_35220 [Alteromonas sp. KUL42]|uniref:hypothetical protein n=1 Tax=Alteromonas sp. KUL42 TaxID=2480797 RepID=UPI00079878B1|nr:hypothetical protein [Alteromonas sp. KUL42]KXJ58104.1 MAG: hypothetical protein AXW14_06830 [Alteromonas sp. Nap_26]TAP32340.1 hypothetical protein EYR97_17400 [Alteromonas sp. KUL42]GEA08761.1 hypothetical protein KUL42_35220 [Alteromonas sp. KUL42]
MPNNMPLVNRRGSNKAPLENSGTIVGFLLLISGAMLLLYTLLDVVVRLESLDTVLNLILACAMFKVGQFLLNHFAVFKINKERRRAVQR